MGESVVFALVAEGSNLDVVVFIESSSIVSVHWAAWVGDTKKRVTISVVLAMMLEFENSVLLKYEKVDQHHKATPNGRDVAVPYLQQ